MPDQPVYPNQITYEAADKALKTAQTEHGAAKEAFRKSKSEADKALVRSTWDKVLKAVDIVNELDWAGDPLVTRW